MKDKIIYWFTIIFMGIILGIAAGIYNLYDPDTYHGRRLFSKDWETIKLYFNFGFWATFIGTIFVGFKFYGQFTEFLKTWTRSGAVQDEVANKLGEWLETGLQEWDISRDAPYFGFEIPNAPGKYFYVWLDAPIGYMASFKNLCDQQNLDFDQFWGADSSAELYHFIGKDIINFHGLFWPAMLASAGLRQPTAIFAHGFLTVDGTKMSKSRGTFIMASRTLSTLTQNTSDTILRPSLVRMLTTWT